VSLRSVAAWSAALLLPAGCSDGYPTHDVPAFDPFSMSQADRLIGLNERAAVADEPRWRFSLNDCVLTAAHQRETPRQFALAEGDVDVTVTWDAPQERYELRISSLPRRTPQVVLSGDDRLTGMQAGLLLKLMARDCRRQRAHDAPAPERLTN
jgi:hypothetical protein